MRSPPSLAPRPVPVALRSGMPSGLRGIPPEEIPTEGIPPEDIPPGRAAAPVPGLGPGALSAAFFDVPRLLPVAVTRPVETRRVAPARPVTPRLGDLRCLFDAFLALDAFELPFFVGI